MPQKEELLDFEDPILPSTYEKFIDYLKGISIIKKLLGILLTSTLSTFIIFYKANPRDDEFWELMIVEGGLFILLMTSGFFLQIIIAIGSAIVEVKTNHPTKISRLGVLGLTLSLSIILLVTLGILALFIN